MYLASRLAWGTLFSMMGTVYMLYQVEVAHLGPLQLVLVGTALEVSAFVCEVPTGILADRYSRKLSVVLGYAITGVAFIVGALFPVFGMLVLAAIVWGLGWTFISGAEAAWLADEVGESQAGKLYLKGQRLSSYGSFAGILVAAALGSWQLWLPFLLSGVLFVLWSAFCAFGMGEQGFTPQRHEGKTHVAAMLHITREGMRTIRGSSTLILLVVVGIVIGTYSEGYDRLWVAHLLRDFTFPAPWGAKPVVVLGAMSAAMNLTAIAMVSIVEKRVNTDNPAQIRNTLAWLSALIMLCTLGFALSNHVYLAILLAVLVNPLRTTTDPLTVSWINKHVQASSRATVLSMHSQSDAFGQMLGGPAVGLVGREYGVRTAISVAALLLVPAVWLYRRARN